VADNHFCVVVDGVRSVRRRIHPLGAGHGEGWGWAESWHRPAFPTGMVPGLRVESVTVAKGRHELRVHRVVGAPHGANVEQTGWATGPEEPLRSTLLPLHGWTAQDEPSAPAGTAFTRWARVPRLTAPAHGTALYAALATLTSAPTGEDPAVAEVSVEEDVIEVRWADCTLTRIAFEPITVEHHARGAAT
jgi:hypothetical protein